MADQSTKLSRAAELIRRAADRDPDLLGAALLALQGALNEQLRALLGSNPSVGDADREALAAPAIPTGQLVDLCRRYGDLDREQAWRIIEAERLRIAFARGEPFRGSPGEIRGYARFVADLCGRPDLASQIVAAPAARSADLDDDDDPDDADPPPAGLYYIVMRWIPGMLLAAALAGGAWLLLGRAADRPPQPIAVRPTDPPASDGPPLAATAPPDATFAPILIAEGEPTALPSPTAAARQGRIVRLGGGPGWLHDTPTFESPTLPIRLSEGQAVAIIGPEETDAQGTRWVLVAVAGYEGWSPVNNVEETP